MQTKNKTALIPSKTPVKHAGGCHCGAVRFEVELEPGFQAGRCNCSICQKVAQTGVIVKPAAFQLVAGEESLGHYSWGAGISTRRFCKHCGIHCFGAGHLAELGGDFVSANLNCLDDIDVSTLNVVYWDGRHDNWMAGPRRTPWPAFPLRDPTLPVELAETLELAEAIALAEAVELAEAG